MGTLTGLFVFLLTITSSIIAHPHHERSITNFVGEGTNDLAIAILQGYVDSESNLAFSPLGYSALLAILAEGAAGETRKQLETALHLPKDRDEIRRAYQTVLERLREKNMLNKPELRNWFYVYKNNSVEQQFQDILREHYLTEVKTVDRPGGDMDFQLSHDSMVEPMKDNDKMPQNQKGGHENVKDPMKEEDIAKPNQDKLEDDTKTLQQGSILEEAMSLGGMKEEALIEMAIQEDSTRTESAMEAQKGEKPMMEENAGSQSSSMKEGMVKTEESPMNEESPMKEESSMKEGSPMKEESSIKEESPMKEESQKKEEPLMKEDSPMKEDSLMKEDSPLKEDCHKKDDKRTEEKEMMKEGSQAESNEQTEDITMMHEDKTEVPMKDNTLGSKRPMMENKPTDAGMAEEGSGSMNQDKSMSEEKIKKVGEKHESMVAEETKYGQRRALLKPQDITSGLSGHNLVSKASNGTTSQMIVFNGMYFRGSWAVPFEKKSSIETFYQSSSKKKAVSMMRALGKFNIGDIPELDARAIELPYEGERYSLLVLLPNSRGGLSDLVASLTGYSLKNLHKNMMQREVEVLLPCFNVETITKPVKAFSKFGVSDVFSSKDAELSGISRDTGLYVQDLVQLVTVRVDETSIKTQDITSSSLEARSEDERKFVADQPFLYFVTDIMDNIIVAAGKIVDPTQMAMLQLN